MSVIDQLVVAALATNTEKPHGLAIPNPQPEAPPGSGNVTQILNWVFWIAGAAGVLGFIAVGVMMMVAHRQGRGDDHLSRLGYVMGGCILVAAASGVAGALL